MKKSILITGSSKGIGKFLTTSFISQGYYVFGCSRSQATIEDENYCHFMADLNSETDILNVFKTIRKHTTQFYGLINNAGIASMNHTLLTPSATVSRIFNINFLASFLCSREASKIMKKYKKGRIINFSTIAVPIGLQGESVYAASKSAVETFSKSFSKEVSEFGITINIIGPNPVKTDLIKNIKNDKLQNVINMQTIKKYGTFEDILNVVNFYLSEDSDMITGQKIYLGGL
jgi:3-oxoacyl-[acyl-carrier protein] reductase